MAEQAKKQEMTAPPGRPRAIKDVPSGDEQLKRKQAALREKKKAAASNGEKK